MTYRLAKKRTLQKAGFVHVAGWVKVEDAPDIQEKIDAAAPKVEATCNITPDALSSAQGMRDNDRQARPSRPRRSPQGF